MRFPPPWALDKLLGKIKDILGDRIQVNTLISAEPTDLSPDPLYQRVTEEVVGKKPLLIRDDGGSDARYFALKGIPVMMSRPFVGNLHAEDEWIDIDSMALFYQIYEQYLKQRLGF